MTALPSTSLISKSGTRLPTELPVLTSATGFVVGAGATLADGAGFAVWDGAIDAPCCRAGIAPLASEAVSDDAPHPAIAIRHAMRRMVATYPGRMGWYSSGMSLCMLPKPFI